MMRSLSEKILALGEYSFEYIFIKKYTYTRKKNYKEYTVIELNIFLIFLFWSKKVSWAKH